MTKSPADQGTAAAKADDIERAHMARIPTRYVMEGSGILGRCSHYPGRGWMFLSNVSSHGNSRRFWDTAGECLPPWARKRFTHTTTDQPGEHDPVNARLKGDRQ